MPKEPKIKFDNLPEGALVLDKEEKKNFFKPMGERSAVDWFWFIVSFVGSLASVIITQEVFHISRGWTWVLWMSGFAIFASIVRQINENKKRRKKERTILKSG